MKRVLILILILGVAGMTAYKLLSGKDENPPEIKDRPLASGSQSGPLNKDISKMLAEYYSLVDAFTNWDTGQADLAATRLGLRCDNLNYKEWKADTNLVLTAKNFSDSIKIQALRLAAELGIDQKRIILNEITGELFDLIRSTRYSGGIIYHIKCPMAFHDSVEGFWLSSSNKIINPYLGRKHPTYKAKMIGCGEIMDSLDFSKK